MPKQVHVVSHGPHCLDGVAAAVAVARYQQGRAEVVPHFAGNSEVDGVLRGLALDPAHDPELWITDISWREAETDAHLRALAAAGVRIYWIDHHRTALERFAAGKVNVPFADRVLSEEFAASRLVYEYLGRRLAAEGRAAPDFAKLAPLIAMADDNDRWLHRVPGSRELAWVVRSLGEEAYPELLAVDEQVTYTPRMAAARARVEAEIAHSFSVANASRTERPLAQATLVTAVCDGHPSEIADAWGKTTRNTVFALYDAKSLAVSLRRSPDCTVDLSRLAANLGGGGHAAARGCGGARRRRACARAPLCRPDRRLLLHGRGSGREPGGVLVRAADQSERPAPGRLTKALCRRPGGEMPSLARPNLFVPHNPVDSTVPPDLRHSALSTAEEKHRFPPPALSFALPPLVAPHRTHESRNGTETGMLAAGWSAKSGRKTGTLTSVALS